MMKQDQSFAPNRLRGPILAVVAMALVGGAVLAADDSGSRTHATGQFDAATNTYTVAVGDDLSHIAQRFDTTVAELTALNKLSGDAVALGQTLVVAAAGPDVKGSKPNIMTANAAEPNEADLMRGFKGKIELDVRDSKPDWKPFIPKKAPEDAPNIESPPKTPFRQPGPTTGLRVGTHNSARARKGIFRQQVDGKTRLPDGLRGGMKDRGGGVAVLGLSPLIRRLPRPVSPDRSQCASC
jgi:LysM repeat protein